MNRYDPSKISKYSIIESIESFGYNVTNLRYNNDDDSNNNNNSFEMSSSSSSSGSFEFSYSPTSTLDSSLIRENLPKNYDNIIINEEKSTNYSSAINHYSDNSTSYDNSNNKSLISRNLKRITIPVIGVKDTLCTQSITLGLYSLSGIHDVLVSLQNSNVR